jgi:hypothetical protein
MAFKIIRNKNCLWWLYLLTDRDKMSNHNRGLSIDASCQVSVHLAKRFQRRRIKFFQYFSIFYWFFSRKMAAIVTENRFFFFFNSLNIVNSQCYYQTIKEQCIYNSLSDHEWWPRLPSNMAVATSQTWKLVFFQK